MPDRAHIVGDFVHEIHDVVHSDLSKHETVDAVRGALTRALESPGWLPERCQRTVPDCYARHLLHQDPDGRFSIVVMVWQAGQRTPVHDHGGVWCVEGVYEGRIRVTRYDLVGPVKDNLVELHARETIDAGIGTTGALIPPVDYHSIENPAERKAITVHTYGGEMNVCRVYLPRPEGNYEVSQKPLAYTSIPGAMKAGASGPKLTSAPGSKLTSASGPKLTDASGRD